MDTQPTDHKLPVVDPKHPVDYSSREVPPSYRCGTCGAHGCKLWRDYQAFLQNQHLSCAPCAAKAQNNDISEMDEEGRYPLDPSSKRRTDQIGWLVPAVPTQENDTFWGYSGVPDEGVHWWKNLPTFPQT